MQQCPCATSRFRDDIRLAYGPPDAPQWGFVQARHVLAPYASQLLAVGAHVHLLDDTDSNTDVGMWLRLSCKDEGAPTWCLCLSYVGPYCALCRPAGLVLIPGAPELLPLGDVVLQILVEHGLHPLSKQQLESPYPLPGLTNTPDPAEVLVFHVLFSDAVHLPWRPGPPSLKVWGQVTCPEKSV